MRIVVIVLVLLIFASCSNGGNGVSVAVKGDFTGFEMTSVVGHDAQMAVKRDSEGNIIEQGMVVDGVKDGTWITYHNDDNRFPQQITSYVMGIKNGPEYTLSNRGQIEEITGYLNNQLHGLYGQYNYGRPKLTTEYKNGQYHGVHTEYFNTGKKQKIIEFKDGKQDGKLQYFDEEGNITLEYIYKDGEKVSGGIVN